MSLNSVGNDLLLYFPGESRAVAVGAGTENGGDWFFTTPLDVPNISHDWTHILGDTAGQVLFYRTGDGHTHRLKFTWQNGKLVPTDTNIPGMSPGWTTLTRAWNIPMFYNMQSGELRVHYALDGYPSDAGYSLHFNTGDLDATFALQSADWFYILSRGGGWYATYHRPDPSKSGPTSWNLAGPLSDALTPKHTSWTHVVSDSVSTVFLDAAATGKPGLALGVAEAPKIYLNHPMYAQIDGTDLSPWDAIYALDGVFVFADFRSGKLLYARFINGAFQPVGNEVHSSSLIEAGRAADQPSSVIGTPVRLPIAPH